MKCFLAMLAVPVALSLVLSPASADPLSPWEKFCLLTAEPGADIDNCLNGLPAPTGGKRELKIDGGTSPPPKPVVILRTH